MEYELIFDYDPEGSIEYSRDFNIDTIDNDPIIFDNISEFRTYIEYLKDVKKYKIDNNDYYYFGIHDTIDIKNSKHITFIQVRHVDDKSDISDTSDTSDMNLDDLFSI